MTQADFGVALILLLVVIGFTLYNWLGPIAAEKRKARRYPLFAIRDQLVCLVADERIDEDDPVFSFMYQGVNQLIPEIKPLSLHSIVRALGSSGLLNAEFLEKFLQAVNHKDPEVRATARMLFSTLDQILLAHSLFVRTSSQLGHPGKQFPVWLQQIVSTVLNTQYNALLLYIKVQQTGMRLRAA